MKIFRALGPTFGPTCGLALGLALLVVNLVGLLPPALLPEADLSDGDLAAGEPVAGFHYALRSPEFLLARLQEDPPPEFDLDRANALVFRSLVHSDGRRLSFSENYLLWLAGKVYEPLGKTQDPERIAAGGGGLCSEAALVLNALARRGGREARFLNLHGHVVSEVQTTEGWRVADPDFGVVFPGDLDVLEGEGGSELLRQALAGKGYDSATIDWYVEVFQTSANNRRSKPGVPSSPRLALAERVGEGLKWLLPLALTVLAGLWARRSLGFPGPQGSG